MTILSDDELIGRLRRTYAAVADSTTVEPPPVTVLTSTLPGPMADVDRPRRAGPLLIAASLLLVVAGVVGVASLRPRDGASATSLDQLTARVRHATLNRIPEGFGLVDIAAAEATDTLRFSDGSRDLTITTRRTDPAQPSVSTDGGNTRVRASSADVVGSPDTGFVVRWTERPGVTVEVATTGTWERADVLTVAEHIVMVTDETWNKLRTSAGFAEISRADRAVVDPTSVKVPDRGRMHRAVFGSLQNGVTIELWDASGLGEPGRTVGRWVEDAYIVTALGDDELIRVHAGDRTLEVALHRDPGMPHLRFASFSAAGFEPGATLTVEFLDAGGAVVDRLEASP